MSPRRALHYVFKIGDREKTMQFYKDILGMKVLRHEEFHEGCAATCNGPYDGKWSKTMVGYGSEDNHFVVELTYNYGISSYKKGNAFLGITIQSREAIKNAQRLGWSLKCSDGIYETEAPGGLTYFLIDEPQPLDKDPIMNVTLSSSNLENSENYWHGILEMEVAKKSSNCLVLHYNSTQAQIVFNKIEEKVDHAKAGGRVAFSCPSSELDTIEKNVSSKGHTILTPLISLDTPGKATVEVVILGDPDGHEICFVGDEGFRELSKIDPDADKLLIEAMDKDKSNEWYEKHHKNKAQE